MYLALQAFMERDSNLSTRLRIATMNTERTPLTNTLFPPLALLFLAGVQRGEGEPTHFFS
jgi:hypothetical protein